MTNSRFLSPKESPIARAALNAWSFPAILTLAAFIRFYRLGSKQLWLDEILQALHSSPRLLKDVLRAATEDRGATPLDYVVQHVITNLLGQSEFSLRFHAALFGTLTIAALYHFARTAFDQRIALVSSLLYAVYPLHHHYSQEGRPYALFTFLTVCSYLAFWRLLATDRVRYWLYYSLVTAFLLYASYYGAFVVFSQVAFSCSLFLPRIQASLPLGFEGSALVSWASSLPLQLR